MQLTASTANFMELLNRRLESQRVTSGLGSWLDGEPLREVSYPCQPGKRDSSVGLYEYVGKGNDDCLLPCVQVRCAHVDPGLTQYCTKEATLVCPNCMLVAYCSPECQVQRRSIGLDPCTHGYSVLVSPCPDCDAHELCFMVTGRAPQGPRT